MMIRMIRMITVRIPGGSEDGSTHTARECYCGQALGFCRVQVRLDVITDD